MDIACYTCRVLGICQVSQYVECLIVRAVPVGSASEKLRDLHLSEPEFAKMTRKKNCEVAVQAGLGRAGTTSTVPTFKLLGQSELS